MASRKTGLPSKVEVCCPCPMVDTGLTCRNQGRVRVRVRVRVKPHVKAAASATWAKASRPHRSSPPAAALPLGPGQPEPWPCSGGTGSHTRRYGHAEVDVLPRRDSAQGATRVVLRVDDAHLVRVRVRVRVKVRVRVRARVRVRVRVGVRVGVSSCRRCSRGCPSRRRRMGRCGPSRA